MTVSNIESNLKLSIVIASHNASQSVGACLAALENQLNESEFEIIVVDNSRDASAEIVTRDFPRCRLVQAAKDKLIPELWGIGILQSVGEIVALTTSHFVPANNWIAEILKAHNSDEAGIGGAIENEQQAGIISWAVYFCRYSAYMLPFIKTEVNDFAADNASYKRRDLQRVEEMIGDGFWETFVHREMRRMGMTLALEPSIIVTHQHSFTFAEFINQRFWHGRQFGSSRAGNLSILNRLMLIVLSPLIPLIYLYRISRRVLARKRNLNQYFLSLPILTLFLISWATGELSGYLWREQ